MHSLEWHVAWRGVAGARSQKANMNYMHERLIHASGEMANLLLSYPCEVINLQEVSWLIGSRFDRKAAGNTSTRRLLHSHNLDSHRFWYDYMAASCQPD